MPAMNPDIITSAPRPEQLQTIARVRDGAPGERPARLTSQAATLWRSTVDSLARTLIRSIAGAPPLRALEAFVDRRLAAIEAGREATDAAVAAHVLRVRARLTSLEQRLLDGLLRGCAIEQVLAMIVHRTEDEAVEILRAQLGTVEPVVSASSLARQIGRVRGELTDEEYDRVILRLPHLSPDEQQSLHSHLRAMTPADAAMLLRSYLRPVRH